MHLKGGICTIHGPGAKRKWEPAPRTILGPDGEMIREYRRRYWYECDLAPGGRGRRLRQLKLSCGQSTLPRGCRDDQDKGDRDDAEFYTPTVGKEMN